MPKEKIKTYSNHWLPHGSNQFSHCTLTLTLTPASAYLITPTNCPRTPSPAPYLYFVQYFVIICVQIAALIKKTNVILLNKLLYFFSFLLFSTATKWLYFNHYYKVIPKKETLLSLSNCQILVSYVLPIKLFWDFKNFTPRVCLYIYYSYIIFDPSFWYLLISDYKNKNNKMIHLHRTSLIMYGRFLKINKSKMNRENPSLIFTY